MSNDDGELILKGGVTPKKMRDGKRRMMLRVYFINESGELDERTRMTNITETAYKRDKKKEVDRLLTDFIKEVQIELGVQHCEGPCDVTKLTVLQYLADYQNSRRNQVCTGHHKNGYQYIDKFKRYVTSVLQKPNFLIRAFTYKNLEAFFRYEEGRITDKGKCKGGTISKNTLHHIMVYFKCAFRQAYKHDIITVDIAKKTSMPKVNKKEARYMKECEFHKFMAHPIICRLDALVKLAILTCCRLSEHLGLRYDDIDSKANCLSIARKILYNHKEYGGFNISEILKTDASHRTIPLNSTMLELIGWLRKDEESNRHTYKNLYSNDYSGYMCVDEFGELYKPSRLQNHFGRICKALPITTINFHGLRHTGATMLLRSRTTIKELQRILGHASYKTTADTYSHVLLEQKEEAYSRYDEYIKAGQKRIGQN